MTTKKLITLAATAAVLGALAYVSSNTKKLKTPSLTGKPVLTALDVSDVQRIEVSDNGQKTLMLEGTDTGWIVTSLFGYPADITKTRANLLALHDLKIGQVATGKTLGPAQVVDLQNATGKSLATLRLGEMHMREATGQMAMYGGGAYPDGRYVATGADTVYLVTDPLTAFDGDPKRWVDTLIAAVPAAQIQAIEITAGGERLTLEKKDGAWTLDDLPDGEELDPAKLRGLESALAQLHLTDLADPALTPEQLGMATGAVYKATLTGGEIYAATLGDATPAGRHLRLRAYAPAGDAPAPAVDAFNARAANWNYIIPAHAAANMTSRRADLVKPKEEPQPENPGTDE